MTEKALTKQQENQNVLSVPHIEAQIQVHRDAISDLQREAVRARYPKMRTQRDWFYCTHCGALYMTWEGCGCAIPSLLERIEELEKALERKK